MLTLPTGSGRASDQAPDRGTTPPAEPPFVGRCHLCRRRAVFDGPEMNRFLRDGWPMCCGAAALIFLTPLEPGRKSAGVKRTAGPEEPNTRRGLPD